jgi:hypothetical protein
MSAVKDIVSSPPKRPASPPEIGKQRKKRRVAAMAKNGFKVPEEQNFIGKADWVFDGPYRRVPPYFYVRSTFGSLLIADILYMGKAAVA